jgi:hypothetical protein
VSCRYLTHRSGTGSSPNVPPRSHLFLTKHTGRRTEECSKRWIWLTIGPDLSIAAIREDRILDEAHATGGDVRRLADLFGLSIQAGTRYTNVISHPDLGSTSRP